MFQDNKNYKIKTCEVCEEQVPIDVETGEVSPDYTNSCVCESCPYNTTVREGGDPIPLKFDV